MASLLDLTWEPRFDAPTSRDRRAGRFQAYRPDPLGTRPILLDRALGLQAAEAEQSVQSLVAGPGAAGLEGLARFLLRSEAIASSRIEGLQVSPQQVALAEFADDEGLSKASFTANAQLVANNIAAVRRAVRDLARVPEITTSEIIAIQRTLLPDDPHLGVRTGQNWLGGSAWHPLDAEFVPPPVEDVPGLLDDVAEVMNGGTYAPLVQAGLVHAQFETIHPFTDGNGRVGRALIHAVLARRGAVREAVLPVSCVMLTRSEEYVEALTAFRHVGPSVDPAAGEGLRAWLGFFLRAVVIAADLARDFSRQVGELEVEWGQKLVALRQGEGRRDRARADSTVARLLASLTETPIMTTRTAERTLGVSFPAARAGLEELAKAGILHRKQLERNTVGYLARDVFELLTLTERRLASTRWDTRSSPPGRSAPALPQGRS